MICLVDRLLPEELWQRIQPLLPAPPPRRRGGVPRRIPDRSCVAALVFMARTSTPWALLPAKELVLQPEIVTLLVRDGAGERTRAATGDDPVVCGQPKITRWPQATA